VLSSNEGRLARAYGVRVASGEFFNDQAQRQAVRKLDRLTQQIERPNGRQGWLSHLLRGNAKAKDRSGIYLAGKVGRGKTMLMDMLFESIAGIPKQRVHFNAFMQDVHARLGALRREPNGADAVGEVAEGIASTAKLLCLDEFQVNDITDAMLLGRLFEALIEKDVFIVVSSNTPADRLYEDGLNRQLFLPFIALIKACFEIIEVEGQIDYRLKRMAGEEIYIWPLGTRADACVDRLWEMVTQGRKGEPEDIKVQGRVLHVPLAARGAVRFTFAGLCEAPLGSADYLALARRFQTIFIERVPVLGSERHDVRRRFISLIDILYDAHLRVVISAAAPPDQLAPGARDFERTASRLQEMQGRDYWASS
jgi:cell division protein ZapE